MIRKQMRYERQPLKLLVLTLPSMGLPFLVLSERYVELALVFAGSIAVCLLISCLCDTPFSVRHSHVGRELMKYGDLKTMIRDVNEQAENAWYATADQAITEKYLMLMQPNEAYNSARSMFMTQNLFCLVSTGEMNRVELQEDERYADEMSTLVFWTISGERYSITVYRSREDVCRIKAGMEQCISRGAGPVRIADSKNSGNTAGGTASKKKRINPLECPSGHTVAECYAGKRKIFRGITAAVILVVAAVLLSFGWLEDYTPEKYLRDICRYPWESALVAAMYIVPLTTCYVFIRRMETQVERAYQRLKHYERLELDKRIAASPELRMGDVLYAQSCFWFRDCSRLFFHNLVLYEDVAWIYPAHGAFSSNVEGIDMPVIHLSKIVFYTRYGKKHSILMADWNTFSSCFPHAIKGYGRQQKKAYREFLK